MINELTTFAAFTALIVFLFAIVGVAIGRWRIDRNAPPVEKPDHDPNRDRSADTDVFSAVRGDDSPTGEIRTSGGQTEERTSSVATVEREREAPTETIRTGDHGDDAKTEVIRTGNHGHEDKTEVIRTGDNSDAKTEVINLDKPDKK